MHGVCTAQPFNSTQASHSTLVVRLAVCFLFALQEVYRCSCLLLMVSVPAGSHTIINFTIMPDEPSGEGEEGTGVTGEATPASAFIDASCSNSGSGTVASQPSGMHAMRSHGLGGGQSARDPAAPSYEDEDIDHFSAYAHHNRAVTSAGHRSGIEVLADAHRLLSGTGESDSDQEASDGVGGGYDREEYGGSQSCDA